nr:substrate-binding domain-containing protein [Bacillota bacterium]
MKKSLLSCILALSILLSFVPVLAEEENPEFVTVSVECPDAEKLFRDNYMDYSNLLLRYADDKTPIPLSSVYENRMFATIPAENSKRALEYFIADNMTFTDAPSGDEYSENSFNFYIMEELSRSGVIKGNEKGEALPFDNITRAEAAAMVMRLLGVDNMSDTDSGFDDVEKDAWYAAAVTKARALGIVSGEDETHFSPMRNVSREEMAALVARCLWISGLQNEKDISRDDLISTLSLADGEEISDWALSAYNTLRTYGTAEYVYDEEDEENSEGAFWTHPKDAATRFFAAYVILDACELLQVYPSQTAISFGFDKQMPKIDGSTSTYPFTDEVYRALFSNGFSHPEMPEKHSKSHASYERLINGEVDMIFASVYPASDILELAKEKDVELELIPIAYDAMVFFTNADNPAKGLTKEQISKIYVDNKYTKWNQLGGDNALLYPYCRNNDSGSHAQMERHFLNGKEINAKIRQESTSISMENILTDVMYAQTEDPKGYGLGYSIYYYFQNMDEFYDTNNNLKLLEIDGVYPDEDTIASGEYPLSNNTYIVLRKDEPENSPARKMAEFMLTKEGQSCVEGAGFGALYPPNPKNFKIERLSYDEEIPAHDGTPIVSISAEYPQISVKKETSFTKSLNNLFLDIKNDFVNDIREMAKDIADYYENGEDEEEEDNYEDFGYEDIFPYENYLTYTIHKNTNDILSLTFET